MVTYMTVHSAKKTFFFKIQSHDAHMILECAGRHIHSKTTGTWL